MAAYKTQPLFDNHADLHDAWTQTLTPTQGNPSQGNREGVREFATGATRSEDTGKPNFEGFLSPLAIARYGEYMHKHRHQSNGDLRAADNWQKGISLTSYMESLLRHTLDVHRAHRGLVVSDGTPLEEVLCAVIFNASGYLHEVLRARGYLTTRPHPQPTQPYGEGIIEPRRHGGGGDLPHVAPFGKGDKC